MDGLRLVRTFGVVAIGQPRKAVAPHSRQKRAGESVALWTEQMAVTLPVPGGWPCGHG